MIAVWLLKLFLKFHWVLAYAPLRRVEVVHSVAYVLCKAQWGILVCKEHYAHGCIGKRQGFAVQIGEGLFSRQFHCGELVAVEYVAHGKLMQWLRLLALYRGYRYSAVQYFQS